MNISYASIGSQLRNIISNKLLKYLISRYLTYCIQLINSLLIAIYLGPIQMGIYGFFTLVLQYFAQINFGIPHSVTTILSINKEKTSYITRIFNTAFSMLGVVSIIMVIIISLVFVNNNTIDTKYSYEDFIIPSCIIISGNYFIVLFTNLYRTFSRLFEIAFSQSIQPILMLGSIVLSVGEKLLLFLVWSNVVGVLISIALFILRSPIKLTLNFNFKLARQIQQSGKYLFLYNASFYLIAISTRFLISAYYSVYEFGMTTFSFSLSSVITLLLDSISFLIFPKIINRLAKHNDLAFLTKIRQVYIFTASLLIYLAIALYPIFLIYFPKYTSSLTCFRVICLTCLLYSLSFGYQGLLIAKRQDKNLGLLAFFTLLLNIILSYIAIINFKASFEYVFFSTVFSYTLYILAMVSVARKKLGLSFSLRAVMNSTLPFNIFLPFVITTVEIVLKVPNIFYIVPCSIFLLLNKESFLISKETVKKVFQKKDIINF